MLGALLVTQSSILWGSEHWKGVHRVLRIVAIPISEFKSYKYPRLQHQCRTKNIYQHYCENPETSSKTKCIMYWGKVSACANLSQGLFPDNAPSSIFSAFWQHFSHPCNSTLPKQIFPASQTQVEKAGREGAGGWQRGEVLLFLVLWVRPGLLDVNFLNLSLVSSNWPTH